MHPPHIQLGVLLIFAISLLTHAADRPVLGLRLADEETLRGIPLAASPYAGADLPTSVDLSADLPPVGQQGQLQSCVAWTVAYALKSYQERRELGSTLSDNRGAINTQTVFSPAFVYNQINGGRNAPTFFSDALNILSQVGAVPWADMPYSDSDYTTRPSDAQIANAKRYRIDIWRRVNCQDIKEVKAQLNAGYPVMIGAKVDDTFVSTRNTPGFTWKAFTSDIIGGHAMLVVGYDDQRRAFRIINSWGADWGDHGYCWIDYTHFPKAVGEAYVAKDAITPRSQTTEIVTNNPTPRPRPQTTDDDLPDLIGPSIFDNKRNTPSPNDNYLKPREQPTLALTNLRHNWQDPNQPGVNFMRFDGTLSVPAGIGKTKQVVIHFHFVDAEGKKIQPVGSLNANFADVNSLAATGTQLLAIDPRGERDIPWTVFMPYTAFYTHVGSWQTDAWGRQTYQTFRTYMVAEPSLFIDNFGVATSQPISFFVDK